MPFSLLFAPPDTNTLVEVPKTSGIGGHSLSRPLVLLSIIINRRFLVLLPLFFVAMLAFSQVPVYQSSTTSEGTGNTATVNIPPGTIGGDLMVVGLMYEKGNTVAITPPLGWTLILRTDNSSTIGMATYYRVAGNGEPASYSFTLTNIPRWSIGNSRITGANSSNPINVSMGATGSTANVTAPGVTTTSPDNNVLAFYTNLQAATFNPHASTTERYDDPNNTSGPSNMMATFPQAMAGNTGNKNAAPSLNGDWVGQQVSINSAFITTVTCGPFTVTYTIAPPNNCTASNGYVTITSVTGGGGGTVTYLWSTISGHSIVNGQTSNGINTIKSGLYNVIITRGANSCSLNILVLANNIGVPSASDVNICSGTSTTLNASGCVGGYIWTYGGSTVSTNSSYTTPILTANATYVVYCTESGSACDAAGDDIIVNVLPLPTAGTIVSPTPSTLCTGGDPGNIASGSPGTGGGVITYLWQSSVSPFSAWTTIGGATGLAYDPPSGLTVTTQYRRLTVSTTSGVSCNSAATTPIQITINDIAAGTIAANQSLCPGNNDPAAFTSSVPGTGSGVITYRWESSITNCSTGFSTIPGATGATFDPTPIAVTTYFRRIAISTLNTVQCEAIGNCVTVSISDIQNPIISQCAATRNISGCSTSAITGPSFSTSVATSSEAEFENLINLGNASDNCAITLVTYIDIASGSCPIAVTRTWTIKDETGNQATCNQTINVIDNAPVISGSIPSATVEGCIASNAPAAVTSVAALELLGLTISDACTSDGDLLVSHTDSPSGTCPVIVTRTYTITDICLNSATATQIINVDDNSTPAVNGTLNLVLIEGCEASNAPSPVTTVSALEGLSGNVQISDACTSDPNLIVTSNDDVSGSCPIVISRNYVVTDACNNTSVNILQTIHVDDNTNPLISACATIRNIEGCSTSALNDPPFSTTMTITSEAVFENATNLGNATDGCGITSVTYIDVATGSCPIVVTRTWTVTDMCSNTSTCNQTINITDTTPPTLNCPVVTSPIQCPSGPSFGNATASDLCDPSVLITFSTMTTPGPCPQQFSVTRTWTATDDCGNSTVCSRTIIVQDLTPPTITCPEVITPIECSQTPSFGTASASDACDPSVAVSFYTVTTPGSCANEYNITGIWTATDDCGNTSTCSKTIEVKDTTPPVLTCPPVISPISCSSNPDFGIATAADACDPAVVITSSTDTILGSCVYEYTLIRTWVASDVCGNMSSCSRTIVVEDNIAPVLTLPVVVSPIECPSIPSFGTATAVDDCDPEVIVTFSTLTIPGSCPQEYTMVRTWTAIDACGNSSTGSKQIVVEDNTPPVIVCPTVTSPIECSASPVFGTATATDLCDPSVLLSFTTVTIPGSCPQEYSLVRTWTAVDDCGNIATCSKTIVVEDNTPPIINCPNVTTPINCPQNPAFGNVTATDACDASVSIGFSTVITPGPCPQERSITRTWTATDDCGNASTCSRTIVVLDDTPPVLTCPAVISPISCTDVPSFGTATATDACDVSVTITFTTITTPGNCAGEYSTTRIWTATDDCGNSSTCSRTIVSEDNTPPVLSCPDVVSPIDCSGVPSFGVASATDVCDPSVSISFLTDSIPGSCVGEYTLIRTWTVTDACGNTSSCSRTIIFEDTDAPVITCPDVISPINCSSDPDFGNATATDACSPVVAITFTTDSIPGPCAGAYNLIRTWTAVDDCGNSSSCSRTIVVEDMPPVISCPSVISPIECTSTPSFGIATATDECDIPATITFTTDSIPGACGGEYILTRTWIATDNCGNSSSCSRTIVVQDNIPPEIVCPTVVSPIECGTILSFGSVTATDECDQSVFVSFTTDSIPGGCSNEYSLVRTWVATDDCGNASSCSRTIIVVDDTPPVLTCPAVISPISCTDIPSFGTATADDACDVSVTITFTTVTTPGNCAGEYSTTRIWTATDDCGNSSTCSRTIISEDNTPPAMSCPNVISPISCSDIPSFGVATATDDCDPSVSISFITDSIPGSCGGEYTLIRTWTATDACGNTSSCSRTIVVEDNYAPLLICPDIVSPINCSSEPDFGTATATDACSPVVTITFTTDSIPGPCTGAYNLIRTWTAVDDCGNSSTCSRTIVVEDDVPPMISCPSVISPIECTSTPSFGIATATDECDILIPITFTTDSIPGACIDEYVLTRTWIATDNCGNTSSCSRTIVVQDNTPPEIVCPTVVSPIECGTIPSFGTVTAIDECDPQVSVSFTTDSISGSCSKEYSLVRTWIATDDCGNSSTCSRTIIVEDNTAPMITCPADVTVIFPNNTLPANTGSATAMDNCDNNVGISYTDLISSSCPEVNIIMRVWLAMDECGNSSTCQQNILVEDHGEICGSVKDDLDHPVTNVTIQLIADVNANLVYDAGDTLISSVLSEAGSGDFCFIDIKPCNYILKEIQPAGYGELSDYDDSADPDGDDNSDGPDNEIPVVLAQGESDLDNNFIDIICPSVLPVVPPDTICEDGSVILQASPSEPGPLNYTWNFGSGATPGTGIGLGPHTVSYITTTANQMGGAIVSMTISKSGCPNLTGQVSTIDVNAFPNSAISGSTSAICYYTNRTFQPVAPLLGGATYNWTFGTGAVPASASGYGPHTVYYTLTGNKTVKLVIHPNEAGAQCPDSSSISFNVNNCPSNITGFVRSVTGAGISGVRMLLYSDNNIDGVADNTTIIRDVSTTTTGSYSMVSLTPGSYVVIQEQPPTWASFDDLDVSNDFDYVANIDSLDNLIPVTIGTSEIDAGNNFIEIGMPGDIRGAVFVDMNSNDIPDPGEGTEGVVISLYTDNNKDGNADNGIPVDTAITSSTGTYIFSDINVGHYVVVKTQPSGYEMLQDFDSSDDTDTVTNANLNNNIIPLTMENEEVDEGNYFIDGFECTLLVLNTNDAGQGSLRHMIDCASSGATITFHPSLAGMNIIITSNRIVINKNVILESTIVPRITISSQIPGLFDIAAGKLIELRSLDIVGGTGGNIGSAFNNFGTLILNDVYVLRNPVLPPLEYLIRNNAGSELTLIGNSFLMAN